MTTNQENEQHITLGQFLKVAGAIQTGGQAKWFLAEHGVFVNGEREERRGRKLYEGDEVEIEGDGIYEVGFSDEESQ